MGKFRKLLFALACLALLLPRASASSAEHQINPLALPAPGQQSIRMLTPTVIELTFITGPERGAKPVKLPDADAATTAASPAPAGARSRSLPIDIQVEVAGAPVEVASIFTKRRIQYAPLLVRDLRVRTDVYVQLRSALADGTEIRVRLPDHPAWGSARMLTVRVDPRRESPVLHVNQEGYQTGFPKAAFAGYYLGTGGELPLPAADGFELLDARTGERVFHGDLRPRRDVGFNVSPRPYQQVYEADFSSFDQPGEYRLFVPGLGVSVSFRIGEGELMNATRAYALGLYHQRCGTALELPFTRFLHHECHTSPAAVPVPASDFEKAWDIIEKLDKDTVKPEFSDMQLRRPAEQKYPFVRTGTLDVSGGHHDAGDYSKYTINSASLVHTLMFAVDAFPGAAELDNLGLPESGDGISDLLQEAKWESDFLAKMQDEDGGFYFLVYPRERRYEVGTPDRGDRQIVWPKNTASTAAAVAALAQCASSPVFRKHFPEVAQNYLAQAQRGWAFLLKAIDKHGAVKSYQRLTHYGDGFQHRDELAWAACELFLATGDRAYERKLLEWYPNPADPKTRLYQWRHASFAYGNALRSYAFAVRTGRLARNEVDSGYLLKCEAELRNAGEHALRAAEQSAYGTSYPEPSKRILKAGWYFGNDEAFDITVAHVLRPRPAFARAVITNLGYELGANPVNQSHLSGLGLQRAREMVHQYALADPRRLPPSGIPFGNLQSDFHYMDTYKSELGEQSWPKYAGSQPFAMYDRWSDSFNVSTEFVVLNQARGLASLAYWAAQTPLKEQPWRSATARISGPSGALELGRPVEFTLESEDVPLETARIVWEGHDQEPAFGSSFRYTPRTAGPQWVEAEATLPDGRRVFARHTFAAGAPVVLWVNGQLPRGAKTTTRGDDTWEWIKPATKPAGLEAHRDALQHESALGSGIHDHGFYNATNTLWIDPGDILFAHIFLDPKNPPKTIMLEFNNGSNEHRAYWGEHLISYGKIGSKGRRHMGPLPPAGKWVRLEVPAKTVGLEGTALTGMVFRLYDGRARWDAAGKMTAEGKKNFRAPEAKESKD